MFTLLLVSGIIEHMFETMEHTGSGPPAFDEQQAVGPPCLESIAMLLAVNPTTLSRSEAVAASVGVELAQRMLTAVGMRFQAQAGGVQPDASDVDEAAAEISAASGMHPATASARMRTARATVARLPGTLAALAAGRLSPRQAAQVERAVRGLDDTLAGKVEAAAVPGRPMRLMMRIARAIARFAPEFARKQAEDKRAERGVDFWSAAAEGVAGVGLAGPVAAIALIKAAIDREAKVPKPGECRSLTARRFDTVLGWARQHLGLDPTPGSPSPAPPPRVPINVTVSAETLLRLSDAPGELAGYGPIPAEVARELAADGEWRRWLLEPGGGRLADVGTTTYRPGAAVDRYVRGRDRTCRFPTCTRPAERCDLDHTLAFHTEHGDTTPGNLTALCRHHHRLKHETDWTYRTTPDGDVIWTAPSGRTYTTYAEDHSDDPGISNFLTAELRRTRKRREKRQTIPTPREEQVDSGPPPF